MVLLLVLLLLVLLVLMMLQLRLDVGGGRIKVFSCGGDVRVAVEHFVFDER